MTGPRVAMDTAILYFRRVVAFVLIGCGLSVLPKDERELLVNAMDNAVQIERFKNQLRALYRDGR